MSRTVHRVVLLAGAALALTSAWVAAQDAPESLLPPGFDKPAARPSRAPAAPPRPAASTAAPSGPSAPSIVALPVIEAAPAASGGGGGSGGSSSSAAAASAGQALPSRIPSLKELEAMSPEQLDDLLGLKPKADIPAAARRTMQRVGVIDSAEGGLPSGTLAHQPAVLVRAALEGNRGTLVSRWGHVLLRRALASRLDAPAGMNPADFAGLRAALLVRMGEGDAARAVVQDVDGANYSPLLTQAAIDAYVATADFTGACPVVAIQGGARKDAQWQVLRAICSAFSGQGSSAMSQLDRASRTGSLPKIDMLLAQKYAGAAGKARRAVTIEWDGVSDMTPWRYGLAIGTGVEPPAALMAKAGARYDYVAATAPMLGLGTRAAAADRAAGRGVLSGAAMVDLYGQIYATEGVGDAWAQRSAQLRDAYVAETPEARLAAMKLLWDGGSGSLQRYSRQVLTAYAAARMPASGDMAADAGPLIASMLSAGLDQNALRWASFADVGSEAWAQLACAAPVRNTPVDASALGSFKGNDESEEARKSAFLLAGLAGLGRVSSETRRDFAETLGIDLERQSRWSRLIDQAAEADNPGLVALLAGLGMQGEDWSKMTPLHLYHIVGALNRVGLSAEARMIAAEAVARG
jgi:hypothetical protein